MKSVNLVSLAFLFGAFVTVAADTANDNPLAALANYRHWTRVTPQPLRVQTSLPAG